MAGRAKNLLFFFFLVVMSPSKACVPNHIIDSLLRGKGTLNQNLSCIISSQNHQHFFLNDT